MILTAEQRAAAMAGQDVDAPASRGAIRRGLWPGGVLVYVGSDNTCITFRERRGNEKSYAYFQGGGR